MHSSRWRLILVAFVAALAGFSLGCFVTSSSPGPALPPASAQSATAAPPSPSTSAAAAANGRSALVKDAASSAEMNRAIVGKFWTTLSMSEPRERMAAWLAELHEMNADNAVEVRGLFLKMDKQGRWFIPEWDTFWSRWGEVDGPAALKNLDDTMKTNPYRSTVAEKILRGWSKTDPAAARAWVEANASSPLFAGALDGYLDGQARANLEKATADALTLGKGHPLSSAMAVVAEQALQQRQIGGLLDWWQSLPEDASADSARRAAVAAVYTRLQRADDTRTQQWLTDLAATPYRSEDVIRQFVTKLGDKDPAAALQWATQLPPAPDGRFSGLGMAIGALAERDPSAAESWLNQLPASPLRDQATAAYTAHLQFSADRAAASRFDALIQDSKKVTPAPK